MKKYAEIVNAIMYHLVKIQNIQISTWTKNNKITRCDTVNFDFVFKKKKG